MKICYLDEQHRTKDKKLHKILNCIRESKAKNQKMLFMESMKKSKDLKRVLTKLYTHNVDVDSINYSELGKIKGKEYYYQMTIAGKSCCCGNIEEKLPGSGKIDFKRRSRGNVYKK